MQSNSKSLLPLFVQNDHSRHFLVVEETNYEACNTRIIRNKTTCTLSYFSVEDVQVNGMCKYII